MVQLGFKGQLLLVNWEGRNNFSLDINDDGTVVAVGEYRDYTNSSVTGVG